MIYVFYSAIIKQHHGGYTEATLYKNYRDMECVPSGDGDGDGDDDRTGTVDAGIGN